MAKQAQIRPLMAKFPSKILQFMKTVQARGVRLILIGGSVRNYFHLNQKNPLDLDFEIRHNLSPQQLKKLIQQSLPHKMEFLPFDIIRLTINDVDIELAPPRQEIYASQTCFKHSEFEAIIDCDLPPEQAWMRRDFTINAIGIDIDSQTLVDPFGGMKDLKNKILRPCGSSFFYDPIRFLRLIRFQSQYGFSLHPDWEPHLKEFNLKELTPLHFFKESFKSPFFPFINRFFDTIQKHTIALPPGLEKLSFLPKLTLPSVNNIQDLFLALIYTPHPLSFQERKTLAEYAKIEKNIFPQQWDFRQNLEQLAHVDEQFFRHRLNTLSMQDFLALKEIQRVKKVHQFYARNAERYSFFNQIERVNPILFKTLSALKILFPTNLEGEASFPPDLPSVYRGEYRLYCHLKAQFAD